MFCAGWIKKLQYVSGQGLKSDHGPEPVGKDQPESSWDRIIPAPSNTHLCWSQRVVDRYTREDQKVQLAPQSNQTGHIGHIIQIQTVFYSALPTALRSVGSLRSQGACVPIAHQRVFAHQGNLQKHRPDFPKAVGIPDGPWMSLVLCNSMS